MRKCLRRFPLSQFHVEERLALSGVQSVLPHHQFHSLVLALVVER